jgi:hypothetical protein
VQPTRLIECALGRAERVGQGEDRRAGDDRSAGRDRIGTQRHLVERRLPADPARRRRDEVALGNAGRIEGARQMDDAVSSAEFSVPGSPVSTRSTSGPLDEPSVRRKPTASSSSLPGVRIVTATATAPGPGPAARISSGSSPTTRSARTSSESPRTATIRVVVTWRVGGGRASSMRSDIARV